jgi:hypothetical protein
MKQHTIVEQEELEENNNDIDLYNTSQSQPMEIQGEKPSGQSGY